MVIFAKKDETRNLFPCPLEKVEGKYNVHEKAIMSKNQQGGNQIDDSCHWFLFHVLQK